MKLMHKILRGLREARIVSTTASLYRLLLSILALIAILIDFIAYFSHHDDLAIWISIVALILVVYSIYISPGKYLDVASRKLENMQEILRTIVMSRSEEFSESTIYKYKIGDNSSGDYIERVYTTIPRKTMRWRTVGYAGPSSAPNYDSFDVLEPDTKSKDPNQSTYFLPLEEGVNLNAAIFFMPPVVDTDTVTWTIGCKWPGLWDKFRKGGLGEGSFVGTQDVDTEISLIIKWPESIKDVIFTRNPNIGDLKEDQDEREITWTVKNPIGTHRFTIKKK